MKVVVNSKSPPQTITTDTIRECKTKLLAHKQELFDRMTSARADYMARDKGGDEVDQTVSALAEDQVLANLDRLRTQLIEVENALARIEQGTFGVCEETEEMIEVERLRAIPWTRLSIEGAEIRESLVKKFAR